MKSIKLTSWSSGFTVIETLMAMAIFTIGILGLFGMQSAAIKENLSANTITTGSTWAVNRIERLLAQNYTDFIDKNNDGCGGLDNKTDATADSGPAETSGTVQPIYKIYWNVAKNCTLIRPAGSSVGIPNALTDKDEQKPKYLRIIVTKVNGNGQETLAAVFNYIKQNARTN